MRPLKILGEDSSTKTIDGIVRHLDSLIFALESSNDHERSEDFLPVDAHLRRHAGEDCGLDVVSLPASSFATLDELRALFLADINVGENALVLLLGDLGSLEGVLAPLVSDNRDF